MDKPNYRTRNYGRNDESVIFKSDINFNPDWIKKGADKQMIEFCDRLGKFLKDHGISSSQLRNIYGEINRIKLKGFQEEINTDFWLLKPKIAYSAARIDNKKQQQAFKEFITKALNKALDAVELENKKTYDNFQKFFEAIIAYHKYHGGKK